MRGGLYIDDEPQQATVWQQRRRAIARAWPKVQRLLWAATIPILLWACSRPVDMYPDPTERGPNGQEIQIP